MNIGIIIGASVIGGVTLLLIILNMFFTSLRKKLEKHIRNNFDKEEIIGATTRANFFGVQSKGGKQLRGNGALVLTKDRLCFIRGVPQSVYTIPTKTITQVSLPKSFNGKSVFSKLLCVHHSVEGGKDAMAWAVNAPDKWKKAIETLIQHNR